MKDNSEKQQIKELAKDIYSILRSDSFSRSLASLLHDKGYRRIYDDHQRQCTCYALGCQMAERLEREVARKLIAEIDNALHDMAMEYANTNHKDYFAVCEMVHHKVIRPIEKKYTEEGK